MQRLLVTAILSLALVAPNSAMSAQRAASASDSQIVAEATPVASNDRIALYQHGVLVDPAFLKLADDAYQALEALTWRKLDAATLGEKIRIYVSDAISVSHVWRGYNHPQDPRGIVFLSARVYFAALKGADATYIHEMAHLFTWRYYSHTLREGLADYLALKILPGASVGPNTGGYDWSAPITLEIAEYLGTSRPPPAWLGSDFGRRRMYYFASYRFVRYLVEKHGMALFMKLYESKNPEMDVSKLYGATREDLVRLAVDGKPP